MRQNLFFKLSGFFLMVCFHATVLNILWLFSLLKSLGAPDEMLECTDICDFRFFFLFQTVTATSVSGSKNWVSISEFNEEHGAMLGL